MGWVCSLVRKVHFTNVRKIESCCLRCLNYWLFHSERSIKKYTTDVPHMLTFIYPVFSPDIHIIKKIRLQITVQTKKHINPPFQSARGRFVQRVGRGISKLWMR